MHWAFFITAERSSNHIVEFVNIIFIIVNELLSTKIALHVNIKNTASFPVKVILFISRRKNTEKAVTVMDILYCYRETEYNENN